MQYFHHCHHDISIHRSSCLLIDTTTQIMSFTWCLRMLSREINMRHGSIQILFSRPICPQYFNLFFSGPESISQAISLCLEVPVYPYLYLRTLLPKKSTIKCIAHKSSQGKISHHHCTVGTRSAFFYNTYILYQAKCKPGPGSFLLHLLVLENPLRPKD